MNTTIVYIPTPVGEKPKHNHRRFLLIGNAGGGVMTFGATDRSGKWFFDSDGDRKVPITDAFTHWLKPVSVSADSPVNRVFEMIEELKYQSNNSFSILKEVRSYAAEQVSADLARSAHISNLESIRDKQLLDIAGMAKEIVELKKELEKIASDAWDAAISFYEEGCGPANDSTPNKETYLKSLNTQS
jgi:hypothetical protein